jgi:glycosyltransferase involved in cell wall biosynthesis
MSDVDVLPIENRLIPGSEVRERLRAATVIATKPLVRSYGWALMSKARRLILDIDDPEIALATGDVRTFVRASMGLSSPMCTATLLALRNRAAHITVANSILGARYGGTVIPHARNPKWFSEESRDRGEARRALSLSASEQLVVFVGTVRRHKGLDVFVEAARMLPAATFVVVGANRPLAGPANLRLVPPVAYPDAVRWLAAADVVVVPQRQTRVGRSQSPAKLVDAMAVGRAIVTSDLPPIRELSGGAARFVQPDSPRSLADEVGALLDDPQARLDMESLSRNRFLEELSTDAVRPVLARLLIWKDL